MEYIIEISETARKYRSRFADAVNLADQLANTMQSIIPVYDDDDQLQYKAMPDNKTVTNT